MAAFVAVGAGLLGRDVPADLSRRLGRPARAAGPAAAHLHAPAAPVDRLLQPPQDRRADLAPDQRRAGARPARHGRRRDALLEHADAGRHGRDPAAARRAAGAGHLPRHVPAARDRERRCSGTTRRARSGRVREKIANVTAYLQETLSGVRIVRAFGQEPRHVERFAELNDEHRAANYRTVQLNASYFPGVELLSSIGTAVIMLYGGYQALDGDITIGVLVAFVGYLQSFFDPIQQLSNLYSTYQQGMAAIDKIFDLLDTEPDMRDAPGRARAGRDPRRRRVRRRVVLLRRGSRRTRAREQAWALRDVSLRDPRRRDARAGRRDGRRQVDAGEAGGALLRPAARRRAGRRARPARGDAGEPAPPARHRAAGGLPVRRHRAGEHRSSAGRRRASSSWSAPRARSARTSSSRRCRTATTRTSASAARRLSAGPAAAGRAGAGADRRPAHPGARRGDRERRRARRGGDRGGPADAARRAHVDRDRAPALDGHGRRPDRGAGGRRRSSRPAHTTS